MRYISKEEEKIKHLFDDFELIVIKDYNDEYSIFALDEDNQYIIRVGCQNIFSICNKEKFIDWESFLDVYFGEDGYVIIDKFCYCQDCEIEIKRK